jgi:L-amino acid N-acyltransferase YncA
MLDRGPIPGAEPTASDLTMATPTARGPFTRIRRDAARGARLDRLLQSRLLELLQRAFEHVPHGALRLSRFYLFELHGSPRMPRPRGACEVRPGVPADVDEIAALEGKTKERFAARFARGDSCLVCTAAGRIVGYEWVRETSSLVEEQSGFAFEVPPQALYAYDGYVLATHRAAGAFTRLQAALSALVRARGRTAVVTMSHADNGASLRAHLRLGFRPYRAVLGVTAFGRGAFIERAIGPAPDDQPRRAVAAAS